MLRSVDLRVAAGTIRAARPLAACNPLDVDCFGDSWYHAILYGIATLLWWCVRMCLIVARGLESVQAWLITNVLGTAFTNILAVLKPWVLMAAALAVLIIIGSQALIGFVQHSWVDMRRAAWAGLTSLAIFSLGATGLASIYQFHAYGAQVLQYIGLGSVQAAPAADSIAFYSTTTTTDAMPPVVSLYGAAAAPCPGTDLRRTIVDPATGATTVAPDQFYLNDYTALYVYADAVDIHCPPATFFLPVAFSDVFFADLGDAFTVLESFQRDVDLIYAVFGLVRLGVGLILGCGRHPRAAAAPGVRVGADRRAVWVCRLAADRVFRALCGAGTPAARCAAGRVYLFVDERVLDRPVFGPDPYRRANQRPGGRADGRAHGGRGRWCDFGAPGGRSRRQ